MSDNNNPQIKYDVFVSFRGTDIRDGFLSHLTQAFHTKKINAFVDDKLEKGEEIWPSLVAAIERSAISLIIFSPDYASSLWCLKEIAKIIECQEKYGRTVIPVFYKVTPTDVRHQSGRYQKAFAEHATKHETELQLWKRALDKSASFSGMESTKFQLHEPVKVGDLKSLLKDNENDDSVAFELKRLEDKALITISQDNIVFFFSTDGRSLPESFNAEKLIILKLNQGEIVKLWDGVKNVVNLKKLDLTWCKMLKELPDLSRAKRLEVLNLRCCYKLTSVHSSIFSLPKLERLDLAFCESLTVLASNSPLLSLRYLNLQSCDNLKKFSLISDNMKELKLGGRKLKALPSSFGDQPKLEWLWLSETGIERLPSLNNLGRLICLRISFCSKLQTIAELPPLLKTLHVDCCHSLKTLPKLPRVLENLMLGCASLESLPELPSSLLTVDFQFSRSLKTLPNLPLSLKTLIACECSFQSLVELPGSLETLDIKACWLLQTLPDLPPDLKTLCLSCCTSLETLPKLPLSLEKLDVSHCSSLETLPKLPPSLETLYATDCISLKTVLFPSLADEQLKENKKLVLFSDSVMLDERAIGFNAKINMMKFANQHLSISKHISVKNYGDYDAYTRSDRCVYMYPGSSVPEWLEYSTEKDCITIDLSSAPPSPKLGFIFSFILDMSSITTDLQCRITTFDGEDGGKSDSFRMPIDYGNLYVGSNHVCILIYDEKCSEFLNTRANNQTMFKIRVTMVHPSKNPHTTILIQQMLKGFGVSPISTSTYEAFIGQIELGDSKVLKCLRALTHEGHLLVVKGLFIESVN
ncbi:unnamed protein product [Sphenostylis stenocarpa]|uniref:TIR domain-containing protein n=1 Tax=Sphenostylis stenocarpa TaxID=92480 RepID=A0AA86TR95_9FABA|nr:unnamed protein product [Sphenostylis stenocarpa]